MLKILTNNCDRETINYIPFRDLSINRLYFSISNEKTSCLTIDCRTASPAKYGTADNNFGQFCYYAQKKKDRLYNKFLAKRVSKDNKDMTFQVDSMINTIKNGDIKFYRAVDELKSMVKIDDRNNVRGQHTEQTKHVDKQDDRGQAKNGK